MLYDDSTWAIILAGGQGTRFWPKSRKNKPKQCLSLLGESRSMIEKTIARLDGWIPHERILVITGTTMRGSVERCLSNINFPIENIIIEPSPRNTAPAITLGVWEVSKRGGKFCVILPSDHWIDNDLIFQNALKSSLDSAISNNTIGLIGILPRKPHTGYGYIIAKSAAKSSLVERFIEKPQFSVAEVLINNPNVWWNSGVFTFAIKDFDIFIDMFLEQTSLLKNQFLNNEEGWWDKMPSVSIDKGLLEKMSNLSVVSCDINWNDIGSWTATEDICKQTSLGTIMSGEAIGVRSEDIIMDAPNRVVAFLGIKDVIVIDTGDVLMIAAKSESQRIAELIGELGRNGKVDLI